ncbi:hypothetical protein KCP70_05945 [Salmonella enterica subsp. enterica]|nr:hypothetical protein KCP70_05945 [Salmonella enterica subsp. enterica]
MFPAPAGTSRSNYCAPIYRTRASEIAHPSSTACCRGACISREVAQWDGKMGRPVLKCSPPAGPTVCRKATRFWRVFAGEDETPTALSL